MYKNLSKIVISPIISDILRHINFFYMEDELYRENILEHNRSPKNWGIINDANLFETGVNSVCGDTLKMSLKIDEEKITNVGFVSEGCAISKASASIFLEHIKDKYLSDVSDVKEIDVLTMLGLDAGMSRKKCALLAYETIKRVLTNISATVNHE